jgi:hypothetical protein
MEKSVEGSGLVWLKVMSPGIFLEELRNPRKKVI